MRIRPDLTRRFFYRRALQFSLGLGGIFDLSLAFVLAIAPSFAEETFSVPPPGESFYIRILAVLLATLAALYLLAASDVRRYSGIVLIAIVGRLLAACVLALAAVGRPDLAGLWPLAVTDAVLGISHSLTWWSIRS